MNKTAIIFPGQGSQSVGMLDGLLPHYPEITDLYRCASDILNTNMLEMIQADPDNKLDQTQWTQPALLTASVAIYNVIKDRLPESVVMAGHSLGEYSALVCAGKLEFEEALVLVHNRGMYMQQAVAENSGAMAAIIGMKAPELEKLCQQVSDNENIVSPANYNSETQIVIAGTSQAVQSVSKLAEQSGCRAVALKVSVPSHCHLMKPAAEKLKENLQQLDIQSNHIPVLHNVDVKSHQSIENIRDSLAQQLFLPVRWYETMQYFKQSGVQQILECGPGKVLSGLYKRFDRRALIVSLSDQKSLEEFFK